MCLRARSWGFVIGWLRFVVVVKVGSPAMMMSIFLERLDVIVFGVMSVGSSGSKLSRRYGYKRELCGVLLVYLRESVLYCGVRVGVCVRPCVGLNVVACFEEGL